MKAKQLRNARALSRARNLRAKLGEEVFDALSCGERYDLIYGKPIDGSCSAVDVAGDYLTATPVPSPDIKIVIEE